MKPFLFLAAVTALIVSMAPDVWAFSYSFHNATGYPIRVIVEVYNGEDRIGWIEAGRSYAFSTDLLLKSWTTEAFLDNQWERVLHLTCDLLPGHHAFSVHVQETKDRVGMIKRDWYTMGH
jgi:hypothetical protein